MSERLKGESREPMTPETLHTLIFDNQEMELWNNIRTIPAPLRRERRMRGNRHELRIDSYDIVALVRGSLPPTIVVAPPQTFAQTRQEYANSLRNLTVPMVRFTHSEGDMVEFHSDWWPVKPTKTIARGAVRTGSGFIRFQEDSCTIELQERIYGKYRSGGTFDHKPLSHLEHPTRVPFNGQEEQIIKAGLQHLISYLGPLNQRLVALRETGQ